MNYGAQKKGKKKLEDGLKNVTYATFLHVVRIRMRDASFMAWAQYRGFQGQISISKTRILPYERNTHALHNKHCQSRKHPWKAKTSEPILWTATWASTLKALI